MNYSGRSGSLEFMNAAIKEQDGYTMADLFERTADKYPLNRALIYTGCENYPSTSLTFSELEQFSNKIAHVFLAQKKTQELDCVALFMQNCIEYVAIWIGLCKAGIKIAFINNSIKDDALVHSINVSNAGIVICGSELSVEMNKIRSNLGKNVMFVTSGLKELFNGQSENVSRPSRSVRKGIKFTDVFGYVYTSGTTGLPKAVNVTHLKQWNFARGYFKLGMNSNGVLYSSGMPMYHSSASGIGTGMILHYGGCQVIKKKFSARDWLRDVIKYKVTAVQYIGEICRYILNYTKETAGELDFIKRNQDKFNIVLAAGNGLSAEIWVEFQQTFGIQKICEFYGSTEGNGAFRAVVDLNDLNKGDFSGVGCIGRIDLKKLGETFRIIKYNVDADDFARDEAGMLVDTEFGEPGECIFAVQKKNAATKFVGYTDAKATKKKVVEDKGKVYVRTGDLLSVDKEGWIRFVDRIGDTFRWRGENVSTAEVASQLAKCDLLREVNVYGVQVPNVEGRAGCAAVVLSSIAKSISDQEFLDSLMQHAKSTLPTYSVPMFVRILEETQVTGTMKLQKVKMRHEGINVNEFHDPLFWAAPGSNSYQPFTKETLQNLQSPHGLASKL